MIPVKMRGRFSDACGYEYEEDGKLHIRQSDLVRCSPRGAARVAREYLGYVGKYSGSGVLGFGQVRHDMFRQESEASGLTASCFKDELGVQFTADHVETEFTTEIDGVVIHCRPDVVSTTDKKVIDYKTTQGRSGQFTASKQLFFYAWVLFKNKIRVNEAVWLCERWSVDRSEIVGYELLRRPITLKDLAETERDIKRYIFTLKHAIKLLANS